MEINFNASRFVPAFNARLSNDTRTQKAFGKMLQDNPIDTFILADAINKAKVDDIIGIVIPENEPDKIYLENLTYNKKYSTKSSSIGLKRNYSYPEIYSTHEGQYANPCGAFSLRLTNRDNLYCYVNQKSLELKEQVKTNNIKIELLEEENCDIINQFEKNFQAIKSKIGFNTFA